MRILGDFKTTVEKALFEIDEEWKKYPGLIVCGTHTPMEWETIIGVIQGVRENKLPFLGICYGHQLAAIEYARNVLGIKDATSEEFGEQGTFVVKKLDHLKVGQIEGETYWNNFEVIPDIIELWKKSQIFMTSQFHPEYQSSKDKPHPLLLEFLYYAKNH